MNKNFRRRVAVLLTAAMAIGSTFTSFAADPNITGTGESAGDVYAEDIVKTVVPSQTTLDKYFSFFVDPERLVNSAQAVYINSGGVTTTSAIGNDSGVYFMSDDAGETGVTFGAISTQCSIHVHNFRDADISFDVSVKSGSANDFDLVNDATTAEGRNAAGVTTKPALYLGIVATNGAAATPAISQGITGAGITFVDTISAQSANYDIMDTQSTGGAAKFNGAKYVAVEKADTDVTSWSAFKFQITGYVSKCNVTNTMIAPILEFTWNIAVKNPEGSPAYVALEKRGENNYLMISPSATEGFRGLTDVANITAVEAKYNNGDYVDVTQYRKISGDKAGLKYIDIKDLIGLQGNIASGDKITIKLVVNGRTYVGTYIHR